MQDKVITFPAKEAVSYHLPVALTPLIGREREFMEVCTLLLHPDVRWLTLTGTGGVGKTRLSMEVARSVQDEFADGVCFVSLATLSYPEHVLPTIAQSLGLRETGERPVLEQLQIYLRTRQLLLVLDNFEQVAETAPPLVDLLTACPGLHLLITSRASLSLPGEHEFPVPPLSLPDHTRPLDETAIAHAAAVQLFVQRARAVAPTFRLTPGNAPTIAAICTRLDGLPLALELAATRIKLLPPHALLKRLESPLNVLTRESDSLPARQQTIRRTIQWSYNLLNNWEQRLFRLCTVFVGGFTLSAVEAVCLTLHESNSSEIGAVLEGVNSLVNKSLLQPPSQEDAEREPRLRMLETVREYGRELLLATGEMETIRRTHATYFLQFVEDVNKQPQGPKLVAGDYENVRAAMTWMLEEDNASHSVQHIEMALNLGILLQSFWIMQGYRSEGWSMLERALAQSDGVAPEVRAQALITAANLIGLMGNYSLATALLEQSLALCKALGDTQKSATCLRDLGWTAYQQGNFPRAQMLYEESLALFQTLVDQRGIASSLSNIGYLAEYQGDYEKAYRLLSESLEIFRSLGDVHDVARHLCQLAMLLSISREPTPASEIHSLLIESIALAQEIGNKRVAAEARWVLGCLAFIQNDLMTAYLLVNEAISFFRNSVDRRETGACLTVLARIVTAQGDYNTAQTLFAESWTIKYEIGDKSFITTLCLEGMAQLAAAQEQRARAVRLCGAAEKLREEVAFPIAPFERVPYQRVVTALRIYFGEQVFAKLWSEGRAMSPEEAFAAREAAPPEEVLARPQEAASLTQTPQKTNVYPDGLSKREVEVLRLLAQGKSDAGIAEHLTISIRTVNTHVTSIYRKIQATNRATATRYAFDHHLV